MLFNIAFHVFKCILLVRFLCCLCLCSCMHAYGYVDTCVHSCANMCVSMCVSVCQCMSVCVGVYKNIPICILVYTCSRAPTQLPCGRPASASICLHRVELGGLAKFLVPLFAFFLSVYQLSKFLDVELLILPPQADTRAHPKNTQKAPKPRKIRVEPHLRVGLNTNFLAISPPFTVFKKILGSQSH